MGKFTPLRYVVRLLFYIFGLFCIAFGVAVSINSNLGISPVNSLPYVISQILGVGLGNCVTATFCVYVFLQFLVLRREFRPINCLQILFSFVFGYFTDFAKAVVGAWELPGYPGRLLMLCISIVLIALGVLLYVEARLVPMPMEGLALALGQCLQYPFPRMKTIVDCVAVSLGIILSFLFFGALVGIGIGTVVTALTVGKVVGLMRKPLLPVIKCVCFPGEKNSK